MAHSKKEVRRLMRVIAKTTRQGTLFHSGIYTKDELADVLESAISESTALDEMTVVRPLAAWGSSDGSVLWWKLPVTETPYLGTPRDEGWPGDHTHWTPLPTPSLG
jgi:metal-dependent amidase/aminoacylase/carboxypeptidase family protein